MSASIVIVDIDGTLANADHRMPLVLEPEAYPGAHQAIRADADWDRFWSLLAEDLPEPAIIALANAMHDAGFRVLLFTARPERFRSVTEDWLKRHGIRFHELHMRRECDSDLHDLKVKRLMFERVIGAPQRVAFVVEDRQAVVDMWRGMGLKCLQCAPGNH
ncbi:MAG: hypothetical protein HYV16_09900 [Gammaproteobacteria bacterium]|nr:hypothetical protein [Gammaproteobacteria bacterium]